MSKESLQSFLEKASSERKLKGEIETAFAAYEGKEALEKFVKIGSTQGYEFSVEETISLFSSGSEELSEEALDGVTGGMEYRHFIGSIIAALSANKMPE